MYLPRCGQSYSHSYGYNSILRIIGALFRTVDPNYAEKVAFAVQVMTNVGKVRLVMRGV